MTQQLHPMLPRENMGENSRGRFVQALKSHIATRVTPGVRELYEHAAKADWERDHGEPPRDRHEIRQSLSQKSYYQLWSALRRTSQHLLLSTVADCIERQAEELRAARARVREKNAIFVIFFDFLHDDQCLLYIYNTKKTTHIK